MPVAQAGFDPTEAGIPFVQLRQAGHQVVVATPTGAMAEADPRMLTGEGLSMLAPVLRADARGRAAYAQLAADEAFRTPRAYDSLHASEFDALLLPGGHAKPMRTYLESPSLQRLTRDFFAADKPVGAICHGVVVAARAKRADGRSVLHGRKTTSLTKAQELLAWQLTRLWLGDYYRTYPETVEDEVRAALAAPGDYMAGPMAVARDTPTDLERGFVVRDGRYVSARWPGDAHRFSAAFLELLR
jgi:protease I